MKKIISIILAAMPALLFAQSAERQVIGSTGGYATGSGIQISSTVGEAVIATDTSATLILTQGFQQSGDNTVGIKDIKTGLAVSAHPNPARGTVMLNLKSSDAVELSLSVFDINGKHTSLPVQMLKVNGEATQEIDFSPLAAGNYYIQLTNTEGSLKQSIKIEKID